MAYFDYFAFKQTFREKVNFSETAIFESFLYLVLNFPNQTL